MFSKKSDGWQNGNLINLKYKKLQTRKEKLELQLDKAYNLLEVKQVKFEFNFHYIKSSSNSYLYTCSNSSSSSINSDRIQSRA